MHDDQLEIRAETVRALLADQAPRWADAPVAPLPGSGTVNAIWRVGETVTARFPLRPEPVAVVERRLRGDAERMRVLRAAIPYDAPEPLLVGRPGHGWSLPWTLQTWVPGVLPTPTSHAGSPDLADDLVTLVRSLRVVDVAGARFEGEGRGGLIAEHDPWVRECLARSEGLVDTAVLRRQWEAVRDLPAPADLALCHTDLTPANLLVRGSRLVGVLDTGDAQPADPALDLVAAWHLLDAPARRRMCEALGCDDEEWERGRAWALEQAIGLVWYYVDTNPAMAHLGRTTLARLLDDPA